MGKLSELIERRFGVKTRAVVGTVNSVAALGDEIARANPDRLALIIINISLNNVIVAFDKLVSVGRGILLAPTGGNLVLTVEDDFELVGYAVYAAASAYPSIIFVLEIEAE